MAPIIEIAIALAAAFWVTSLASSSAVEWLSQNVLKKRAKDLDKVLRGLLDGDTTLKDLETSAVGSFKQTSVYRAMQMSSSRKRGANFKNDRMPSYISARSFADGVVEVLIDVKGRIEDGAATVDEVVATLPDGPLKGRLITLLTEVDDDLVRVKAGLEGWFDDSMDRLEGAYKRWSQWVLLLTGFVVAAVLNISAVTIALDLWNDAPLRAATADAVLEKLPCPDDEPDCDAETKLEEVGLTLPVGWSDQARPERELWPLLLAVTGWLITGLATMLGAPFWFDILGRLGNLRQTRGVPPKAPDDAGSASSLMAEDQTSRRRTLSDAVGVGDV